MKKIFFLTALLFASITNAASFKNDGPCDVYFSPKGGVQDAIVNIINKAQHTINVLAYSFTSTPISNALIAAKNRGVDVKIVLDKKQPTASYGKMKVVMDAGIPVWVDSKHAIAHNKVILIDGKIFETGSFNYSAGAETSNGENALICPSIEGYNLYFKNWTLHQNHSVKQ